MKKIMLWVFSILVFLISCKDETIQLNASRINNDIKSIERPEECMPDHLKRKAKGKTGAIPYDLLSPYFIEYPGWSLEIKEISGLSRFFKSDSSAMFNYVNNELSRKNDPSLFAKTQIMVELFDLNGKPQNYINEIKKLIDEGQKAEDCEDVLNAVFFEKKNIEHSPNYKYNCFAFDRFFIKVTTDASNKEVVHKLVAKLLNEQLSKLRFGSYEKFQSAMLGKWNASNAEVKSKGTQWGTIHSREEIEEEKKLANSLVFDFKDNRRLYVTNPAAQTTDSTVYREEGDTVKFTFNGSQNKIYTASGTRKLLYNDKFFAIKMDLTQGN